jgi:hypothetical protein
VGLRAGLVVVWKISPPARIRFPDRPARSESLYRLSYPASKVYLCIGQNPSILVVARSEAWVCFGLLAGTAGSNLAGSMKVCLL